MKQFLALTLLCASVALAAEETPPSNLQDWINTRIRDGETKITVPTSVYRLSPQNTAHLEFYRLKNIEIDFQQSEIVCMDRTLAIYLEECEGVTLKNLSVDYDPMLYAQGRITAFTPEYFEIDVFEGYPIEGLSTKDAEVYDPDTHELKPGFRTFHDLARIEHLEGRTLRIHRERHLEAIDVFVEVGDILLVKTKQERIDGGNFTPHGVFSERCKNMRFERITVYASNCFAFLGEACSNIHYYQCRVDRRKDDPKVGFPRMRSSNWDAFHSINAEIGPTIEECYAGYMGDDAVNIRGDYHIVAESTGSTLTVIGKRALNIQVGDPVEVVSRSGEVIAKAVAVHVERDRDYPKDKMEKAKKAFKLLRPGICRDAYRVELDRDVQIDDYAAICAVNRIGNGFKVINNVLGHNRSRGILTKASNGIISGNIIEDTGLESLKLTPDIYDWLEAAYYENLIVTNNTIRNGKFSTHFGSGPPAQILIGGCRNGLVFSGNTIEYNGDLAMIVSDLDGGIFRNNSFKPESENPILFKNCLNLDLE